MPFSRAILWLEASGTFWLGDGRFERRPIGDDGVRVLKANARPIIGTGQEMVNATAGAGLPYPRFADCVVQDATARCGHA